MNGDVAFNDFLCFPTIYRAAGGLDWSLGRAWALGLVRDELGWIENWVCTVHLPSVDMNHVGDVVKRHIYPSDARRWKKR